MRLSRTVSAVVIALAVVGLAACGDDDGAGVRDLGGEASGSASGSGTASGSGPASGSGTASGSGSGTAAECSPVNEDLEASADETVEISLVDYAFDPATIEVAAGTVTFAASNDGDEAHELAFLPGGGDVPFTDGAPDEAALEDLGAFELEGFAPGTDCNATYELEAGEYTLFCIIEAEDGKTHYDKGMRGTLTVG